MPKVEIDAYSDGPIWHWFSLSYASYLVVPRRVLCSMPQDWQECFVSLLNEMTERFGGHLMLDYQVTARRDGRYISDSLHRYRHEPPVEPFSIDEYQERQRKEGEDG